MIEPVQVYARIPALLRGYAKVEQATAGLTALPDRVKASQPSSPTVTHWGIHVAIQSVALHQVPSWPTSA